MTKTQNGHASRPRHQISSASYLMRMIIRLVLKTKILVGLAIISVAVLLLYHNCSPIINTSQPSNLQAAKIAQLFNIKHGASVKIDRFQMVYHGGFHDTIGSCGFKVKLNPAEASEALKYWSISKDPDFMKTNVFLIDWINKIDLIRKTPSFYTTTTKCVRSSKRNGTWVTWTKEQHCIAFWDLETSNTLIVSTEGEMFLPDAIFK